MVALYFDMLKSVEDCSFKLTGNRTENSCPWKCISYGCLQVPTGRKSLQQNTKEVPIPDYAVGSMLIGKDN